PVLYDGVPGGDAVRAAAVGAEEAERAERGHRGSGVSGAGRLDDAAAGRDGDLADGAKRLPSVGPANVDVDPGGVLMTGAQDREHGLGIPAAHGFGQICDRAGEAVNAA